MRWSPQSTVRLPSTRMAACSPGGAKRNPGRPSTLCLPSCGATAPGYASLHPGYEFHAVARSPRRAYRIGTLIMSKPLPPNLAASEAEHDPDEFTSLPGWLYHDDEFFAYEAERV